MLKNDTLKNDTSGIGLYGSAPPGCKTIETDFLSQMFLKLGVLQYRIQQRRRA